MAPITMTSPAGEKTLTVGPVMLGAGLFAVAEYDSETKETRTWGAFGTLDAATEAACTRIDRLEDQNWS